MPGIGAESPNAGTPTRAEKMNAAQSGRVTACTRDFILTTCLNFIKLTKKLLEYSITAPVEKIIGAT